MAQERVPTKPDPAGVFETLEEWAVGRAAVASVLFVGDQEDDLRCARAAGAEALLLTNHEHTLEESVPARLLKAGQVGLYVHDLAEFSAWLGSDVM